jgi:hypothetical protein
MSTDFHRICVKLYAPEPAGITDDAAAYVPIFHQWIRDQVLDVVAIDVADYAHVPSSPGIMLVAHEVAFALDRSDGRFGLLAQRRTPIEGGPAQAVATTLRQAIAVAERLEREPSLGGQLQFDKSAPRVESNDRLRAPNTSEGYAVFEPIVREGVRAVYPGSEVVLGPVVNDPRDRLAIEVRVAGVNGASATGVAA